MLDKTYRKHITNSKLLNESTKKIYLSKLDVIQYDIWKNCKTTQKIGKGKCLHYIINHPEAFIEKMDEIKISKFNILKVDNVEIGPHIRNTLQLDKARSREEALFEIFKILRPGEPPTIETAELFFNNLSIIKG